MLEVYKVQTINMRKQKQRELTLKGERLEQLSDEQVEKFLTFIESEMDKRNLSVPDLARMMELKRATLYPWFNRKSIPSIKNCYRILGALGYENMPSFQPYTPKYEFSSQVGEVASR